MVVVEMNKSKFKCWNIVEFFRNWWAYLFLQYELITCTCMFEPWEKIFINGLILSLVSLVSYSLWVYLPQYLVSLFSYFGQLTEAMSMLPFDFEFNKNLALFEKN